MMKDVRSACHSKQQQETEKKGQKQETEKGRKNTGGIDANVVSLVLLLFSSRKQ